MPKFRHEAEIALFRNRPELAGELLAAAFGLPTPRGAVVRVVDSALTEVHPVSRRADLVVVESVRDRPIRSMIVEGQRRRDWRKRWSWPAYVMTERGRLRCDVVLIVVALDPGVARWAATPIKVGQPGCVFTPLVLGPAQVPCITDDATALANPELAVLSVLAHGQGPHAEAAAASTLTALRTLDDERSRLYHDLLFSLTSGAVRHILEAYMNHHPGYQSDFARRYYAEGKAEGKAEGEAEGQARAILTLLRGRGLKVSAGIEKRILATADPAVLERWLLRAIRVERAQDVVAEE